MIPETGRTMHILRISSTDFKTVKEHATSGRKIRAVKHVRENSTSYIDGVKSPHRPGLREAKEAVEHAFGLQDFATLGRDPAAILSATPRIKRVVVDCEDGELELDLDGLQLRLLEGLDTLPLAAIAPAMELMQMLRDFDNGRLGIKEEVSQDERAD